MKILIVGINFHPEITSTGKYTTELAAFLAARGHQVHVVTAPPYYPQWRIQPGYSGWRYQKELWNGIEIRRCPLWVPRKASGIKRLVHLTSFALSTLPVLLGQIFWKPDLVLCIAPSLLNAPFSLVTARLSGAKAWLHIQDFELDAAANLGILPAGKWLGRLVGGIERGLLNSFDQLSTISNRMMARLVQKGVPREKTTLLPNWVDTDVIHPLPEDGLSLKGELRIPDDKTIVLYAGNMGMKQGLEIVMESAKLLCSKSHIHFVLCGDGAVRADLEQSAAGLSNVQFLPLQPAGKLNQLLNTADIHILPQRAEAADLVMPSKLSGMLASGKVVVATANTGTELAEVLEPIGVVVPPGDAAALSEAVQKMAADPKMRLQLGEKGLNWVIANWSKDKVLEEFCRHVETIK
jgi:colanic acid biosynthesis glycosyl transferase WcaI